METVQTIHAGGCPEPAVSRMTVLRPKVSMCRCEGSPSPHELSFTRSVCVTTLV